MFLVRLIYASRKDEKFNQTDIEDILSVARTENAKDGVTGLLCFNRKYFLQCLEGSRSKVNATYRKILNDPRHSDIVLLSYDEISVREFDNWHMGYIPETALTDEVNLRYSGNKNFTPFEMTGESCHQMMRELVDTVPLV